MYCQRVPGAMVLAVHMISSVMLDPYIRLRDIKGAVVQADREASPCLMYTSKAPLIAEVRKQGGSWPALWDTVHHLGSRHTVGLQHLSRMQAHHGRGPKPCPLCEEQLSGVTLTDHVLSSHNQEFQLPSLTPESLLTKS